MSDLQNETSHTTNLHRLAAHAAARPTQVAVRQKRNGIWHETTWRDYWRMAGDCALGLNAIGIAAGERVAILSTNRQEWAVCHLGITLRGAVSVGLYAATTQASLAEQLRVTQPVAVVCEDQEQLDKLRAVQGVLATALRAIVVFDMRGITSEPHVLPYDELLRTGATRLKENPSAPAALLHALAPGKVASVALSSGTSGERKAIEVSYGATDTLLKGLLSLQAFDDEDEVLSLLPLAHPTEQMFSLVMPIAVAATVNFPESQRSMQEDIREIAPTVFIANPRVWEGLRREVLLRRGQTGRLRQRLFDGALAAAQRSARRPAAKRGAIGQLHARLRGWGIPRGLQDFLGLTRARFLGSVGAVTAPEALDFFRRIGLPLRNVYSLAEVGGLAAIGAVDEDGDTLGALLPTLQHRIGTGGLLEIRGTTEADGNSVQEDAGFVPSGDMVEIRSGRLRLLGRRADVMTGAQGGLHPSAIERLLKSSPFIREVLVTPREDGQLQALVQIDFAATGEWAKAQRTPFTTFASLAANPAVAELVAGAIRASNQRLEPQQRVAAFALLHQELDTAEDELTPLLTVRRNAALKRHAPRLAAAFVV